MSFNEESARREAYMQEGFDKGYALAMQKVREAWLKYKENWDNGNPLSPNELKELIGLKGDE